MILDHKDKDYCLEYTTLGGPLNSNNNNNRGRLGSYDIFTPIKTKVFPEDGS